MGEFAGEAHAIHRVAHAADRPTQQCIPGYLYPVDPFVEFPQQRLGRRLDLGNDDIDACLIVTGQKWRNPRVRLSASA
jgi:hypothetical protein